MAGPGRTDLLGRLADMSEEALQRLADVPGADRFVGTLNTMRDRIDELQKRVRGLEALEQRLETLERKVDKLSKSDAAPATTAGRTKTSTTKSSGGSTTKPS